MFDRIFPTARLFRRPLLLLIPIKNLLGERQIFRWLDGFPQAFGGFFIAAQSRQQTAPKFFHTAQGVLRALESIAVIFIQISVKLPQLLG